MTKDNETELKLCPFCGGEAELTEWDWGQGRGKEFSLRCTDLRCSATAAHVGFNACDGDRSKALNYCSPKWNTRADQAPQDLEGVEYARITVKKIQDACSRLCTDAHIDVGSEHIASGAEVSFGFWDAILENLTPQPEPKPDEWRGIDDLPEKTMHLWLWIEYNDKSGTGCLKKGFYCKDYPANTRQKIEIEGFLPWDYETKHITHHMPYTEPNPPKTEEE